MDLHNEDEMRAELQSLNKDRLIDLFMKLKKNYMSICQRLEKVEQELLDKTSLDELIESIDKE